MWGYSNAANEPSCSKIITLNFLTTICRNFLVKLLVWIIYIHVDTWRRFHFTWTWYNTEAILSVLGDATLQNNKLCQKYFSMIFSNGAE